MTEKEIAEFKPEVSYNVTVEKTTSYVAIGKTKYRYTHKQDAKGEDIWTDEVLPPHVATKSEVVYKQTSGKTDVLALIAAVNGVSFRDR